ncbi:helix-turn-helix transcriptional regulator [Nocardioides sp. BYT-33-1]|uniref:helix-turn-helix transcriptional regulator n=1 Tax=Nocardioides sp. BYT-33-1 TaxID=3416952 RepID=UPI003F53C1D5
MPARPGPAVTATEAGGAVVEEFPYGLGPPDGILALRYPPTAGVVTDFPESRNDFVHQIYLSPDGVIAIGRGGTSAFAGPTHAVWVRQGVVAEVTALEVQTVVRLCVRRAPEELLRHEATVLALSPAALEAVARLVRPGTDERAGLAARGVLLAELAASPADPIGFASAALGPAQAVARALTLDPADRTGLTGWAERLHVSAKTLQREFERVYGMSFSAWRTRTRLEASRAMLSRWSVTETAHRVGYATASSYVAAFTRAYGEPPGRHAHRAVDAQAS